MTRLRMTFAASRITVSLARATPQAAPRPVTKGTAQLVHALQERVRRA